jgi:hypothetical protein
LSASKKLIFFVLFTALILAYYQTVRVDAPNYDLKFKRHSEIISNTVEYPYKYRLLNPYIANVTFTVLKFALPEKAAFLFAYFIQNLLVYGFLIFSVLRFFRLWFTDIGSVTGTLFFALLVPLSLTGYDTLGDMTTTALIATAFYFINTGKVKLLYPLIIIGAFNELQLILIIPFYFFSKRTNFVNMKVWFNSVLLVIIFLVSYYIIYLIRGGYASGDDYKWYFTKDAAFNIAYKDWILLWLIMITPLLYFVIKGFKNKPEFLKRSAFIVLPLFYFGAFFFIARLREIDKALTIFLILIPLALYTLIPKHVKEAGTQN